MKVLLVGMCDSVHTARWIAQFEGTSIEFVLFPSTPHRRIHPLLLKMINDRGSSLASMRLVDRYTALCFGVLDLICGRRIQAFRLDRLLESERFHALHLLETQHAGYLYDRCRSSEKRLIPVALSVWGSDLVWFSRLENHKTRITRTLKAIDLLFVECVRDVKIARDLGFEGRSSNPVSAGGGVSFKSDLLVENENVPPSLRRAIVLKGYTGFVGRARVGIRAVISCRHLLTSFRIHVYSCGMSMMIYLRIIRWIYKLDIRAYRKKKLQHNEVLALFRESRVSMSVSMSDGLPGSFREATWTGAFPIESIGSCINEWIDAKLQVQLINPNSVESVKGALFEALNNSALVDEARILNLKLAEQFSVEETRSNSIIEYEKLLGLSISRDCEGRSI